jgi:hypothetical protein
MAISVIEKNGFGSITANPTLPFTAPSDGLFVVQIQAAAAGLSYNYMNWTSNGTSRVVRTSTAGAGNTSLIPLKRGDRLEQGAQSNVSSDQSYNLFIPL